VAYFNEDFESKSRKHAFKVIREETGLPKICFGTLLIKSLSCEVTLEFGCIAIVAVGPEMVTIAGLEMVLIELKSLRTRDGPNLNFVTY